MSSAPDNKRVPDDAETIGDVLLRRSREHGDDIALRFLGDGKTETATFTYAQLQAAVDARAADLLRRGAAGERVGLVYGSCPEFIVDLFSCFAVGAIAVPLAPPRPNPSASRRGGTSHVGARYPHACAASSRQRADRRAIAARAFGCP